MNPHSDKPMCWDSCFLGSVTVGERGQIVIPAEARQEYGFNPGDKLLVMRHPAHKGLMIFKMESVREFLDDFDRSLRELEKEPKEEG
ncbi:MAG: AbrB/MazE/SpoVT family DNA-binding domain-containing protein [Fimbriimonadaceae bacterium]|nr:AbrB/MazE/SpoVT family DNA-binding domain-containing protein [Fimbriimonadaceae bacterium]